jgi:2-polyprenyl-3-methyl-5-hydroxy-6-metoxy-1,4-benzoquinol methylase
MIKSGIKAFATKPKVANKLVDFFLNLHQFSYRMAGNFSQYVESDGLHPKHRLMQYHKWFEDNLKPEWNIVDIGCGNGALAEDLAKHCQSVTGIDMEIKNVEKSKKRVPNATFIHADATTYEFGKKFDAVVLSNVLEHIEHRVEFLKKIQKLTSLFLIRVPMIDREWVTLYKKERGLEYRLDPTHFTEFTWLQFLDETGKAGLKVLSHQVKFGEIYAVLETA